MHLPFTPNHILLIDACYPPPAALNSSPNSQELSRLTYYAANKSGKLTKLGSEMEKRIKAESKRAQANNARSRASLLVSLQILRALATECRRDLSLLTPALLASVAVTLQALPTDLEICAKAATLFTTWTTYTDGRLIGVDQGATKAYMFILEKFAKMSIQEGKSADHEFRNRTRLVGLAVVSSVVNSEALYTSNTFRQQVPIFVPALLSNVLDSKLDVLHTQSKARDAGTASPYLEEFRARPPNERRAASIHVHKDGEHGPSSTDLVDACLGALQSLFAQCTGSHITHVIQAVLSGIDERQAWIKERHCCWLATRATEWSQYQYRYAVPTKLIERLVEDQDAATVASIHTSLAAMITAVFTSSLHLINLSTSDSISNLLTLVLRRVAVSPDDRLLPSLAGCIASLGSHIYYSDQIQDLASEVIGRLLTVDSNGVPGREEESSNDARYPAIRYLLASLVGLILAPGRQEALQENDTGSAAAANPASIRPADGLPHDGGAEKNVRLSKRAKVSPETWQDTLHLLCSEDYNVRSDYAYALAFFVESELTKRGEFTDAEGNKRLRPLTEGPLQQMQNVMSILGGDENSRFLHAMHVYLYILATATSFHVSITPDAPKALSDEPSAMSLPSDIQITPATPTEQVPPSSERDPSTHGRPSLSVSMNMRTKRTSTAKKMLQHLPSKWSAEHKPIATASDYRNILDLLTTEYELIPVKGLLAGVPFLVALDTFIQGVDDPELKGHVACVREVITRTWLVIGRVWECQELVNLAERAISTIPGTTLLPPTSVKKSETGQLLTKDKPVSIPADGGDWFGVDSSAAINALVANDLLDKLGFKREVMEERLRIQWTPDAAWADSTEAQSGQDPLRGDNASSRLRLAPGMMHIENLSLQSLARSGRGVGVSDLRDALQGRASMSNPTLAGPRAPSISTLDHASSAHHGESIYKLTPSRSRPDKPRLRGDPSEVRDVLNKLRIGKGGAANGSGLLKSSFPLTQKSDAKPPAFVPPYKS
ncbi:hypothetical protein PENSPDRAFT_178342 [Peniophora sp. CONT]|nr:hypothetical protein PENSPDRAFT_178342 [Peniophora sp. CONT]